MTANHALGTVHAIAVPGGNLHVEVAGSGPPLVLLHGWTLDSRMWRAQVDGLRDRYSLIAIDRRGFGLSSAPADLSREADDVLAVASGLGLDAFYLWGMSQGGRVALRFAQDHPDWLRRLIVQSTPLDGFQPGANNADAIPVAQYRKMVRDGDLDAMRAAWRAHRFMACNDAEGAALLDQIVADYQARDLLSDDVPAMAIPNMAAKLDDIRTKTDVVVGGHDTDWLKLVARAIAYGIPGARLHEIPGAGHFSNITHAAMLHRLL